MENKKFKAEIREIPVNMMGTEMYQRRIYPERIKLIRESFDERVVSLPIVCWQNDHFEIVDGQHTVIVLRELGYTHIDCIVIVVDSLEEAARLFSVKNMHRFSKRLTPPEEFHARRISKDEIILKIDELMAKYGLAFGNGTDTRAVRARRAIESIFVRYNEDVAADTFSIVTGAFPGERAALNAAMLRGIAYYIKQNRKRIDVETLKRKLRRHMAEDIINEASSSRMFKGQKAFETVLRGIYGRTEPATA